MDKCQIARGVSRHTRVRRYDKLSSAAAWGAAVTSLIGLHLTAHSHGLAECEARYKEGSRVMGPSIANDVRF